MSREMEWSIKRSLVSYVRGMADGTCTCTEGAEETMPGVFRFSADPGGGFDEKTATGTLKFQGTLHFRGHHGMLSVVIADPWLECTAEGTLLSIVDPARFPDRCRRKGFATLGSAALEPDPQGRRLLSWADPNPRLQDWGAMLFHDAYPEGTELDPIRVGVG
jgi:hypothetical protein